MADEQIVTSIVARADLSSLVSQVHKATASLQQMQRELLTSNRAIAASGKVANNLFKDTLVSSGMYASHFVNLTSDVDKFGKQLDAGRLKLRDYFQTFRTHATTQKGLIRELAEQQVMLQNAIFQPLGRNAQGIMQFNALVPRGLDAVKSKTALARMEMQIMNRALSEGATSLINWGKNTQWAGRQLTVGLTVPLTMFGTAAGKAFREADQELIRLQKVYGGLSATSSTELAKVRKDVTDTAKTLASSYGATFKETLGLAADIAATGKQGNELLGSIKETTRLAILGEVDRQDAMKATLAIQSAFKQNTEELAQSINFLNAVENQTSTTLQDLVEAIPKAGPVIKGLGGSVKDLALYLTAMREGGINASEGANALKSGLASLINPTKVAQARFKEFGIDLVSIVNKNAGNVTQTLLDLQSALDKLDPLSKQQAIEQLFGKFQFSRMNALFENLGKSGSQTLEVLKLMKASASDLEGIASRELKMVTESSSGKFRRAIETLKADLALTGERFLDMGTKFINAFDKILKFFEKLPEPIKKAITYLGGFTAIIGPVIMLTGLLANFFGYITKGVVTMRAFFMGSKGWKLLTPEILATEKASRLVEKGFYSDAQAAQVLHGALTKLISDYATLSGAAAKAGVPTNPVVSTATAGNIIMSGALRREVDPTSVYAGDMDTRAMSHVNPRDPNNPASLMGVVPGAIPVNRGIAKTPQIYMHDRLPDVPGVTSVKGISTGIVAGEAARFHALMATLGMQTEAEVAALKKTIALGGTVSSELLATFDDILPMTTRLADNAATQSAAIVAQLRAGKLTVDAAKTEIMAVNAQLEAALKAEVAAYAASRGRTIDFTKAPLMNQSVTDANAQFTLRDLYKKEGNKAVMEEFGRLRGIRTFGAPYSIQTTRLPKFNVGGDVESFGPGKTTVSGPASINYDDRLGRVPVGGYVLNQSASMDPSNAPLVAMADATYEDGGEITAALTPREVVFGPKIQQMPELYAAVDAANNGYSFGGQIMRNTFNYGRDVTMMSAYAQHLNSPSFSEVDAAKNVAYNASMLSKLTGMNSSDARKIASDHHDEAMKYASERVRKNPRLDFTTEYTKARNVQLIKLAQKYPNLIRAFIGSGKIGKIKATSYGPEIKNAAASNYGGDDLRSAIRANLEASGLGTVARANGKEVDLLQRAILLSGADSDINKSHFMRAEEQARIFRAGQLERLLLSELGGAPMTPEQAASFRGITGVVANQFAYQATAIAKPINQVLAKLPGTQDILSPNQDIQKNVLVRGLSALKGGRGRMSWAKIVEELFNPKNKSSLARILSLKYPKLLTPLTGQQAAVAKMAANSGGPVPGGRVDRGRLNYGNIVPLLAPEKILKVLTNAKQFSSKKALGSFADEPVTSYGHRIASSSGKSYPIPGVSGLYKNDKGELVFFKGVPNEITAKAEVYGTRMAREVFELDSPVQTIKTIKNPYDPSGQTKLMGLESPFDPKFAVGGTGFNQDQMIRQTIASLLMGNKDLSRSNVYGNVLADVGPAGVFAKASMNTEHAKVMNSMEKQAMINLLAVRGGARKDFAYDTAPIAAGMTPRQYGSKMKAAMKKMHPKLKQFIESLPESDRGPYIAMLNRLEDGMAVNWSKYQSIHANPAFNKGGGVVRSGRKNYGKKYSGSPERVAALKARDAEKARIERENREATLRSHAPQGSKAIYTGGLGREARRATPINTGGTSTPSIGGFYNPGQVMRDQMLDPFRNSIAMKAQYIQASFAALNSSIIKGSIRLNLELMNAANSIGKGYTRASTSMINGVRKHANNLLGKASLLGADMRQSQAMFMANAGYNVKSDMATGRPINMETGKQVSMFGPGLVGNWNQGGVYDSSGRLVEGASTRKVGTLGIRQREFLINDERLSAKEAAARGYKVQGGSLGMGGQMGLMMGGQMAAQMAMSKGHDKLGYGISIASIALMLAPLGKLTAGFKAAGTAIKGVATGARTLKSFGPTLLRLAKGFGLVGGLLMVGEAVYKVKKHMDDLHQKTRLTFGMTEKGAEAAGIKYFNLAERMKLVAERQKALQAANRGAYQSGTVPGLQMSIKDLAKEKENAKKNLGEFIESFNVSARYEDTLALAKNLKAQFIASGMGAQEASKKIYGIIAASNKANDAFKVFADQGFSKITDQASAATYAVQNFTYLISGKFKGDMNAAANEGVKTLINSFESLEKSLVGTKNSMGEIITEGDAFRMAMEKISQTSGFNNQIGSDVFSNMPIELQAITNESDTIAGILAKWKLYSSDVVYNFKEMSSTAAVALAQFNQAFQSGIDKMEAGTAAGTYSDTTFKRVGDRLKALKKITDANSLASQRAAAKAQRSAEDEIKLINKKIQAIEDEKNAKLEALDAVRRKEDYQIQIQKAQLDYQDAIARGDMAAAARAQLQLREIEGQRQDELARASIEAEAKKQQDALRKKAEDIQDQQNALNRRNTIANERSADAAAASAAISGFETRYQGLLGQRNQIQFITDPKEKARMQAQSDADILALLKEIQAEGSKKGLVAEEIRKAFKDLAFDAKGNAIKLSTTSYLGSTLTTTPNLSVTGQIDADIKAANMQADKIVSGITGGLTLKQLAIAMGLKVGSDSTKGTGGKEFGKDTVSEGTGKDAFEAAKKARASSSTRMVYDVDKSGIPYGPTWYRFSWNGKDYVSNEGGTEVWEYDPVKKARTKKVTKKDNYGSVAQGRSYLIGSGMSKEVYQPHIPGAGGILFEPKYSGVMKPSYGDTMVKSTSSSPVNLIQNNNLNIDKANVDPKQLEDILSRWSKKNAAEAAKAIVSIGQSRSF